MGNASMASGLPGRASPPAATTADILAGTYLFRDLPAERLQAYAARFRRRRFPRGAYVFRQGELSDTIGVLAAGQIKGSMVHRDGEEEIDVIVWRPSQVFGEPGAMIDGAPRIMDAVAISPCECLLLDREELLRILEEDPLLMRRMLAHLAEITRDRVRRMADRGKLDVAARVARTLLDLAATATTPADDSEATTIELPMSQRTLAGLVGTTRESVNRALASLIADGVISQRSGSIAILRRDVLAERGGLGEGDADSAWW